MSSTPSPRRGNGGSARDRASELRVECAWCNRLLSEDIDAPVSHGICKQCSIDAEFHREHLDNLLNRLAGPVLAVDDKGAVVGANDVAAALLGFDLAPMTGELAGDVISCVYAELPGGCGRTTHCSGCAIRKAFEHTAATGEPIREQPAFSYTRTPQRLVWKCFLISTERIGGLVLVRIEGGAEDTSGRVWH